MIKRIMLLPILLFWAVLVRAQSTDTLNLDLPTAEKILLENNLRLLAEELNLDIAEAEKIQAKIWPNPSLSIEQINPYVSSYQKRHAEEQASLFGSQRFGRYRQVEIQLEQVFNLAGKRKKQKALAEVAADKTTAYLEDFLWDLKTEFRKTVVDFAYHQLYAQLLQEELESLQVIVKAYERQYRDGNINKMELTRLKASEMNLKDEIIDEQNTLSELQTGLIVLLNLPETIQLRFDNVFNSDYQYVQVPFELPYLQEQAIENRPDVRVNSLEKEVAEKKYHYEKAERTPDLGVSVNYDRGGGIYPDYVGFGLSMDLPFSNPNKGKIKKAKINIQQREYLYEEHLLQVKTEIRKKYNRVQYFQNFLKDIDPEYEEDLDQMMTAYTEYFRNQNINITTYMDFLEAYIDNKESLFDNQREYLNAVEDLKYATGIEFEK